jgi:glutamyl-tRNA synthetase
MKVRTRIAPSPTGIAHIGTAYIALINYAFSRSQKGKFILRIEDTDRERYVPGAESVIYDSLKWLGIQYDEGPDIGGKYGPYIQSKRLNLYEKHAQKLIKKREAYYCFCSQERLAAMRKAQKNLKKPPMYDGTCRKLSVNQAHERAKKEKNVVRLKVPKSGSTAWKDLIRGKISFNHFTIDDQVLLKSDGYPTYHLAVVVDDYLMKISHVIRGEEWISSTPKHILLYKSFGWKTPIYAHTPLLRNPDRSKLSKRRNNVSIMSYKEQGFIPQALVNYLCLMGWSHPEEKEKFPLSEYISKFSLDRIQSSQPIFDLEKLSWLNGRYIREKSDDELLLLLKPFLPKSAKKNTVLKIIPLVKERIHTLQEFREYAEFFFSEPQIDLQLLLKQSKHTESETQEKLKEFIELVKSIPQKNFKAKQLEHKSRELLDGEWNAKKLFMSVRIALTGKPISPPLFDSIEVLGRSLTIKRLENAIQKLK